jgi:hypothetical protein
MKKSLGKRETPAGKIRIKNKEIGSAQSAIFGL